MTAIHAAARLNSVPPRAKASSTVLALCTVLCAATLNAQQRAPVTPSDSARAAADSVAARLRRAEESIALLQQQIAEQASSGVTTHSRMQLEITGRVLVHAFSNDRRVNNVDDPQFVRPDSTQPLRDDGIGLAIRQTTLGIVLTSRDVLGGQFVGDVDVDFFGGQQPSSGGRTFPLLRIRTARGAVRWTNGELMIGQEMPLISPLNPVSPAAIGTPAFAAAGNLWLWLPQVRGTIETTGAVRFGLQAAVLANTTGDAVGLFDTDVDAAERSQRPATEVRGRARWGEDDRPSEVGCGGHVSFLALPNDGNDRTGAIACDARLIVSRLELRGEAYKGRGLRGLGGGGIGQNVGRFNAPLDDRGGWAQINVEANALLRLGAGCGIDTPTERDVLAGGRLRNQACSGYGILRPSGPLFFGAEFRRLQTKYATGSVANNHFNLSGGFEF
ncbi:MAG: hypothetical protein ABI664_13310 [bacterium]